METALDYLRSNRRSFLNELAEFIRIPSISAQPERAKDVRRCARWLAGHLHKIGLQRVRIAPTPRHPLVLAEWRQKPGLPTLLIYGHYDVQPVDPISEWRDPPFSAVVRGEDLYGRGACDDKGQLFTHLKAIEALLATQRALPVNLLALFEGEEEIGSPNLAPFVHQHRADFRADAAVISDTRILAPDKPAITYALRGGLGMELVVHGPQTDLHSGLYGGAVYNPLQALCEILASLHDPQGRIAIPGFYRRVRAWSPAERSHMARSGPNDTQVRSAAGVAHTWGEPGYSLYERTTIRPALTINGLSGGYQGRGGKAVIPSQASAKLSFRLVPDQDPAEIERLVCAHLQRLAPPGIQLAVHTNMRTSPALIDRRHPVLHAAAQAYQRAFGRAPVFLRSGGSIPVVNLIQEALDAPVVLMGFALPDSRLHAPNERLHLPTFFRGCETALHFMELLQQ